MVGNSVDLLRSKPIKLRRAPDDLPAALQQVVDYRKSGLSLNHIVGCPLDCGYCVRHLFANFEMKRPHLVLEDEVAVEQLLAHWAFRDHVTPIQLLNRATDPFLPGVKDHLFRVLEILDARALRNPVLVITRWHVERADIERLEKLANIRLTILVTWSGIEDVRLEPVESSIAEASLRELGQNARRTKSILYWRPLIAGINDTEAHFARAREIAEHCSATVFSGLFHRDEIRAYLRAVGLEDTYPEIARRKILPEELEARVLAAFTGRPIFRKTSCGIGFAHETADYNGHFGLKDVCDICPEAQIGRCAAAHVPPDLVLVRALAQECSLALDHLDIDDRRIEVQNSTEQQRYFIQHALNYQVHDKALPHLPRRHGRAEVGWS